MKIDNRNSNFQKQLNIQKNKGPIHLIQKDNNWVYLVIAGLVIVIIILIIIIPGSSDSLRDEIALKEQTELVYFKQPNGLLELYYPRYFEGEVTPMLIDSSLKFCIGCPTGFSDLIFNGISETSYFINFRRISQNTLSQRTWEDSLEKFRIKQKGLKGIDMIERRNLIKGEEKEHYIQEELKLRIPIMDDLYFIHRLEESNGILMEVQAVVGEDDWSLLRGSLSKSIESITWNPMLVHALFLKVDSTLDRQPMTEVFTQMGKDSTEEALKILNGWIKDYPSDLNARALRVLLMDGLDSDREYGLTNKSLLILGVIDANMLIKYKWDPRNWPGSYLKETKIDSSYFYYARGIFEYNLEIYESAKKDIEKYLSEKPGHFKSLLALTKIYLKAKEYENGIKTATRLLNLKKKNKDKWDTEAYYYRGIGHYKSGNWELAIKDLDKAVNSNEVLIKRFPTALTMRALAIIEQGTNIAQACSDLQEAKEMASGRSVEIISGLITKHCSKN